MFLLPYFERQRGPLRFVVNVWVLDLDHVYELCIPLARAFKFYFDKPARIALQGFLRSHFAARIVSHQHCLTDKGFAVPQAQYVNGLTWFRFIRVLLRDHFDRVSQDYLVIVRTLFTRLQYGLNVF